MVYYWWIPTLVLMMVYNAYLSSKASSSTLSFILLCIVGAMPLWAVVAKFSRNVMIDAMIYDSIVGIVYGIAIMYFSSQSLTWNVIIGSVLCMVGVIILTIK